MTVLSFNDGFVVLMTHLLCIKSDDLFRGGSRTAATPKVELFVIIVNGLKPLTYYQKELHLGCCSSPRSASVIAVITMSLYCSYYGAIIKFHIKKEIMISLLFSIILYGVALSVGLNLVLI